jgi:uncharacterized protein YebE (UPF0316 family)
MSWLSELPVWSLAAIVFLLRIVDVSMGTLRTVTVVQGHLAASVLLGFFEVLVWVAAVSQVVVRIGDSPVLAVAFAGGFAAGNGVGILLERRLALGHVVLRIISQAAGPEIAAAIRGGGQEVTTFQGEGHGGSTMLLYVACSKKRAGDLVRRAADVDPELFYVLERSNAPTYGRDVIAHPTGWRAFWKKK